MRRLLVFFRDQLSRTAPPLRDADPAQDVCVLTEHTAPDTPEHTQKRVYVVAAQRYFRDALREQGFTVHYEACTDDVPEPGPLAHLARTLAAHSPTAVHATEPGSIEQRRGLQRICDEAGVPLTLHEDTHFLCTRDTFTEWVDGRKSPTLEYFYREQRRAYNCLLTDSGDPIGGDWNYDKQNRESFGADGPGLMPDPPSYRDDPYVQEAIADVNEAYPDAPGRISEPFPWPVTPQQAQEALNRFIDERLPTFGTHQDAMWTGRPWLSHSQLSPALNLKLLDPRDVIRAAETAYHDGHAPLNAVEGFIRQILGWREFIRGLYWHRADDWPAMNELGASEPLPDFYWTGDTQMACMHDALSQVVDHAYGHHIQRLMITGLFGLLYGINPQELNDWHEAFYIDAWPWVSVPNMLGMSQYADSGYVGTKPYTASGKYVNRMSNYCSGCQYDPAESTGAKACPFTTLYWDFLDRHEDTLSGNRRMNFQLANVRRKGDAERSAIAERAADIRTKVHNGTL
ncbi:MAG: cryptochrome/photolyase family protein [Longimonas sp.]|uniref:cryptochrome/photolyase family protein n=1 Tax=Longimonas sp. TaxID=2039626 RepID=UPI0033511AC1